MGCVIHKAIIVTTWDRDKADAARLMVPGLLFVSPLIRSNVNSYWTLLVGPGGSKEGRPDAERAADARDQYIEWLNRQRCIDGGSYYEWVEVEYGHDLVNTTGVERMPSVTAHAWEWE